MTASLRCVAIAVLLLVALGAAPPGAASAHGGGQPQPDAAFYRTSLTGVAPAPKGVGVRVDPAGEWIELTNSGADEVVVLGYTREPYLRVTADRVDENQLSQTTYLNRSLFADSLPTAGESADVAPSWKQIGGTGTVRWHDHRIHWMGGVRPPPVDADPRHRHLVGTWTVHATAGGQPFDITGDVTWIGKPDSAEARQPIPTWLLTVLEGLAVLVCVLVVVLVPVRRRWLRNAPRAGGGTG
jgi:hypothetical protein